MNKNRSEAAIFCEAPKHIDNVVSSENLLPSNVNMTSGSYTCDDCDYQTRHKFILTRHRSFYCTKRDLNYQCNLCDFKAGEMWCLVRHMQKYCRNRRADHEVKDCLEENGEVSNQAQPEPEICEYERIRNSIVSERQDMLRKVRAEMKEIDDEVSPSKKKRTRKIVPQQPVVEPRRSSRINIVDSICYLQSSSVNISEEDEIGDSERICEPASDAPNDIVEVIKVIIDSIISAMLKKKTFKCDSCRLEFRDSYNLRKHMARKHLKPLLCKRCKINLEDKAEYDEHQKECFYNCTYEGCEKKFKQVCKLSAHERKFTLTLDYHYHKSTI